jgi:hypothetical protein
LPKYLIDIPFGLALWSGYGGNGQTGFINEVNLHKLSIFDISAYKL